MSQNLTNPKPVEHILIYGNSIAAHFAALALSQALGETIKLTVVQSATQAQSDVLYGGITSPEAYDNHLQFGLTEPELLLQTNTTFSLGTHYQDWHKPKNSWVQCFNQPFAVQEGVEFPQIVMKHQANLQDFMAGAQAALAGRFAHPPTDQPAHPLSRAEYGYHFDHESLNALLIKKVASLGLEVKHSPLDQVSMHDQNIECITLKNGETVQADLYLDCSGTDRSLFAEFANVYQMTNQIAFDFERAETSKASSPARQIQMTTNGWQAHLFLTDSELTLTANRSASTESTQIALGHYQQAWVGNCIGFSQAAYVADPVSPAPYKLLMLDIHRLLELIPINTDMKIERKEYNRRYRNDIAHAELFAEALYDNRGVENATSPPSNASNLLDRKLTQFLSRGIIVKYDLEPFNTEDWTILHHGMGRRPQDLDKLTDQFDAATTQKQLAQMKARFAHLATKMPEHAIYLSKLKQFLKEQQ